MAAKPELVFLDIMMPKINGFDLCEKIRHEPGLENSYVVFLSAKAQSFDKEMGARAGANDYITKPFDLDVVIKKAETVLGIKPGKNRL